MEPTIQIRRLWPDDTNLEMVGHLNDLIRHLSEKALTQYTESSLREILSVPTTVLYIAEDLITFKPVGTVTICHTRTRSGWHGHIDDVVVLPEYRRQHIADALMDEAILLGEVLGWVNADLTSNKTREAAWTLYAKKKFYKPDTTYFRRDF